MKPKHRVYVSLRTGKAVVDPVPLPVARMHQDLTAPQSRWLLDR